LHTNNGQVLAVLAVVGADGLVATEVDVPLVPSAGHVVQENPPCSRPVVSASMSLCVLCVGVPHRATDDLSILGLVWRTVSDIIAHSTPSSVVENFHSPVPSIDAAVVIKPGG